MLNIDENFLGQTLTYLENNNVNTGDGILNQRTERLKKILKIKKNYSFSTFLPAPRFTMVSVPHVSSMEKSLS